VLQRSQQKKAETLATRLRHWFGTKKYQVRQCVYTRAYRTATPLGQSVVSDFWEGQAAGIDEQWGCAQHDFHLLRTLLQRYRPKRVLDVGCGSGRLFGLFAEQGITDLVGIDISGKALVIARQRYPRAVTIQCKVEELDYPPGHFDLALCNRVLQHIPPAAISGAVERLCRSCRLIYVNELTESDQQQETFFMFRHPYPLLFGSRGLQLLERGAIGAQTFQLFGAG
jgi:2-polyprenyl-3-methyl-5-hydroxy-6-metoxy-1,4-benzoquinol methylase